jgi:hypothetical protein
MGWSFNNEFEHEQYFNHCRACRKEVAEQYPDPVEPVIVFLTGQPIDFSSHRTVAEIMQDQIIGFNRDENEDCIWCGGTRQVMYEGRVLPCLACECREEMEREQN